MSCTDIRQAWGGLSGSNMLSNRIPPPPDDDDYIRGEHPAHRRNRKRMQRQRRQQQRQRRQYEVPPYKTENDLYQCQLDGKSCQDVVKLNNVYNQAQKDIATGGNIRMPESPYYHQQNPYVSYLPQYPWYPNAKSNYFGYSPAISQAFYTQPWIYYPQIASQLYQYQQNHPSLQTQYYGYSPVNVGYPGFFQQPPSLPPQQLRNNNPKKSVEHFSMNKDNNNPVKTCICVFISVLIILAIIIALIMIAFSETGNSNNNNNGKGRRRSSIK